MQKKGAGFAGTLFHFTPARLAAQLPGAIVSRIEASNRKGGTVANVFEMNVFAGKAIGGGTATDVSQVAIPADTFRKFLGIYNNDENNILWLNLGGPAVAGQGIAVYPRDGYEMKFGDISFDAVHVVADTGLTVPYSWLIGA